MMATLALQTTSVTMENALELALVLEAQQVLFLELFQQQDLLHLHLILAVTSSAILQYLTAISPHVLSLKPTRLNVWKRMHQTTQLVLLELAKMEIAL